MAETKQAHTVPRFYLESFTGPNPTGQVWNYDKDTGKRWSAIPKKTGKQAYYYAVTRDDGTKNLTIEDYLSDVETKAKAGYELLLNGIIPDGQARADFSTFIATQYTRTSTMRQLWAESYCRYMHEKTCAVIKDKVAFEDFMKKHEEERKISLSEDQKEKMRADMLNPSNFILSVPQDITIRAILSADDLMEAIFDMEWAIGYPKNKYFITGDNPVAAYGDKTFIQSGAHPKEINRHPQSMLDFPLSPKSLLVLTWDKMQSNFMVSDSRVIIANKERAIRAKRFIYAHMNDDAFGELANDSKGAKWGLRSDNHQSTIPEVKVERKS